MYNCTEEDIPIKDLTKPCYYFARELEFQKEFSEKSKKNSIYQMKNITDLSRSTNSPIEVHFKSLVKKTKKLRRGVVHCGMTRFGSSMFHKKGKKDKKEKSNGWCATKLDTTGTNQNTDA
jgi:hypothetical protein